MKGAAFGKPGNANMRGKLSIPWADDTLYNIRERERIRLLEQEIYNHIYRTPSHD